MTAITVHMTVGSRNASVAHRNGNLMKCFGQQCPEIPVIAGTTHVGTRITLHRMVQIRKLQRIAQKEYRCIISYQIPVSLFSIKFNGKSANITFCIGGSALARYRRKTDKNFCFFSDLRKDSSFGIRSNIMSYSKLTEGS